MATASRATDKWFKDEEQEQTTATGRATDKWFSGGTTSSGTSTSASEKWFNREKGSSYYAFHNIGTGSATTPLTQPKETRRTSAAPTVTPQEQKRQNELESASTARDNAKNRLNELEGEKSRLAGYVTDDFSASLYADRLAELDRQIAEARTTHEAAKQEYDKVYTDYNAARDELKAAARALRIQQENITDSNYGENLKAAETRLANAQKAYQQQGGKVNANVIDAGLRGSAAGVLDTFGYLQELAQPENEKRWGIFTTGHLTDQQKHHQEVLAEREKEKYEAEHGAGTYTETPGYMRTQNIAAQLAKESAEQTASMKAGRSELEQLAVDMGVQGVQMAADAAAGRVLPGGPLTAMALRTFGSSVREARDEGANIYQQGLYGAGSAAVEVLTEKMFDGLAGVYGAGAADDIVSRIVGKFTNNRLGQIALGWAADSVGEGLEEFASDLANPFLKMIYEYDKGENILQNIGSSFERNWDWKEVGYDFLVGAAMGFAGGSVENVAKMTGLSAPDARSKFFMEAGEHGIKFNDAVKTWQRHLIKEGYATQTSDTEITNQANEYLTQLDNGKKVSERKINKLNQRAANQIATEDIANTVTGVQQRMQQLGLNDERMAQAIAAVALENEAERIGAKNVWATEEQRRMVERNPIASRIVSEMDVENLRREQAAGIINQMAEMTGASQEELQRNIAPYQRTNEWVKNLKGNKALASDVYGTLNTVTEAEKNAVTLDGEKAKIVGAENGKVTVEQNGERRTVDIAELKNMSESFRELVEAAPAGQSGEAFLRLYREGQDIGAYTKAWDMAENMYGAQTNVSYEEARSKDTLRVLTDTQLKTALEMGRSRYDASKATAEQRAKQLKAAREEAKKNGAKARKKGTVNFNGGEFNGKSYKGVDLDKLSRPQKNVVAMVNALADAVNINFVVYDGEANTGGSYLQGGTVMVNINAGEFAGKIIGAATLSHELTHYLQDFAPEQYQELKDFITSEILKKSPEQFDKLVQKQMDLEPDLSYDEATDELIANACQTMLLNSEAVTKLARQNMSLAEKIADWISDTTEKIKAAFADVDLNDNVSVYAAAKSITDVMDEAQKLWDKALEAATENYNAAQATGKKISAEGGIKFQKWQNEGGITFEIVDGDDKAQQKKLLVDAYSRAKQENRGIIIPKETVDKYFDIYTNPDLDIKETVKKLYEETLLGTTASVSVEEGTVVIKFENDGKKKSVGWRMKPGKAATFEYLKSLVENSVYAYSETNRTVNEASSIPLFHYFGNVAEIAGEEVPIKIQARDILTGKNPGVHYYTHNIDNENASSIGPVSGTSPRIDSNALDASRKKSVPQNQKKGKKKSSHQNQILSAEYAEAVENNDMDKAAHLVNQAAKDAGAILNKSGRGALHLYHGTPSFGFTEFRPGMIFLADNKSIAAGYTQNKGYGRVRQISEAYTPDDGTTKTLIKNLKNVLGHNYREVTDADVDEIREEFRTSSGEMSEKVNDVWDGKAMDALHAILGDEYTQEFENKLYEVLALPGYINEWINEIFEDPTSDTAEDIKRELERHDEYLNNVRDVISKHNKELRDSAAKDLRAFIMGYDLSDFLIDAQYKMIKALDADNMLMSVTGSLVSKERLRQDVEQTKDVGAYDLYGFAGDNPLEIDGKGAFWTNIEVPELGGVFMTDEIGRKAKEQGYTSVIIHNIMDSSMNEYATNIHSDVYIFFDSEQVKSADPVTYDEDGNVIPLDERFNLAEEDIRYQKLGIGETAEEQEARKESFDNLKAENKILRARAEYWKAQTRKTKENTVRQQDTDRLARELLKKYESRADKAEVKAALKELGDWLVQTQELDYNELYDKAEVIAEDIISGNYALLDNSQQENLERLKDYLKSTPVNLTAADFRDTGDEGFRKKYGRYFTVRENGRTIDSLWGEMAAMFGEGVFPEDTYAPGDMLNMIADYLDLWKPQYGNEFEMYHGEAVDAVTNEIIDSILSEEVRQTPGTFADKAQQKLNAQIAKDKEKLDTLRAAKNARIEELKRQAAEKNAQIRLAEKAAKYEAVSKVKQHYQDMLKRQRNKRGDTAVRTKIKKLHKELTDILLKPREGRYVPKELVKATAEILGAVDTTSGRAVKAKAALAELKVKYDALAKDQKYALTYDETVSGMLQSLTENLGDGSIYDLTGQDLEGVYNTLRALKHTIQTANKLVGSQIEADAFEAANQMMNETENAKGIPTKALRKFVMAQMTPSSAFRMFGGYVKNSMWEQMFNELNNGQLTQTQVMMEGGQIFRELIDDKKNMAKLHDRKNLVDIGLKDEQGNAIKVTRGMMLSVYMHLLNEQNARHVAYGGFTVPRLAQYYKNKMQDAYKGKTGRAVAFAAEIAELNRQLDDAETVEAQNEIKEKIAELQDQTDAYMSNLRAQIEKQLTDYDRKWIAAAQEFFDVYSKGKLNEVTEQVYGFSKAQVDNYFPIHTDPDYRAANFETIARDMSLENAGFMKERVNGTNPILLEDITDVISSQLRRTAQYVGLMPAIRNFNKVYGKARAGYSMSVQSAMARAFENEGKKYIENLMADLNGARKTEANIWDELRGRMAGAVLTLNPRVTLAQTASFPTAAAEIGYKPLAKALVDMKNPQFSEALRDEIAKWTPLWWYRMQGFSTTELGDIKNNEQFMNRAMSKIKWLTNWIQWADGYTTGALWQASKYYVDDNFSDLKKGSDEYMMKVAEVYNRVIEKTQPDYTTLQRPDILRNPNAIVKQLTMFMTQRLQNTNLLYDAAATYSHYVRDAKNGRNGVTNEDVKIAGKRLAWAVSSQVAASMTIVIFKALADTLMHNLKAYRDDDEELTEESVRKTMIQNLIETLSGNILWGSEVYSFLKSVLTGERYYGVSLNGVETFTDALSDGNKMLQNYLKGNKEAGNKAAWKLAKSVAQFIGIPLGNLEKFGQAVVNHIEDAKNGEFGSFEAGVDRTRAQNTHILFDALQSGDTKKAERIRAQFESEKEIRSALKGYIHDQYVEQNLDRQTTARLLQRYAGMTKRDAEKAALEWLMEIREGIKFSELRDEFLDGNVSKAKAVKYLETYGKYAREEAEAKLTEWSCEKETGIPYSDIPRAVKTGEITPEKGRQLLMKYGGMDEDKAQKTVNGYEIEMEYDIQPSELEQAYMAFDISDAEALDILQRYKYYGKDDAEEKSAEELERMQFVRENPDAEDITITQVRNYRASGLDGFVSASDFFQAAKMMGTFKGYDEDGNGKTDRYSVAIQKLEYIDSFDLSPEQKTALAIALGINEKTIRRKAPWR